MYVEEGGGEACGGKKNDESKQHTQLTLQSSYKVKDAMLIHHQLSYGSK